MAQTTVWLAKINENVFLNPWLGTTPLLVLFVGTVLRSLMPESLWTWLKATWIFSESNVLNKIFADHGFPVFTILYLLTCFSRILVHFTPSTTQLLPSTATTRTEFKSKSSQLGLVLIDMFAKYLITFLFLVVFLSIKAKVISKDEEFVISGHYIGITTLSVTILWEVREVISHSSLWDLEDDEWELKSIISFAVISSIMVICLVCIVTWWCVLSVTTVFYHTLREKCIGLIFGYLSPLTVYYARPVLAQRLKNSWR